MGKARCQQNGPAQIGIRLTGQRAEPRLDRIDRLERGDEPQSIGDLADLADAFECDRFVLVGHRDGQRHEGRARGLAIHFLKRRIGVFGLRGGIVV